MQTSLETSDVGGISVDFSAILDLIRELQLYTGLSPPAILLLTYASFKALLKSAEDGSISKIVAVTGFNVLFWWLIGYLLINPLWNYVLGKIPSLSFDWLLKIIDSVRS